MTCRPADSRRTVSLIIALMTVNCGDNLACGDGGRLVRVERTHGWLVSVFVAPDPPRVGPVDVSVLVQEEASGNLVADADVAVTLTSQGNADMALSAPASRAQATNKLLKSALLQAPSAGDWQGTIHCSAGNRTIAIPFELQIVAAPPAWTKLALWFLWPFAAMAIFFVHRAMGRRSAML